MGVSCSAKLPAEDPVFAGFVYLKPEVGDPARHHILRDHGWLNVERVDNIPGSEQGFDGFAGRDHYLLILGQVVAGGIENRQNFFNGVTLLVQILRFPSPHEAGDLDDHGIRRSSSLLLEYGKGVGGKNENYDRGHYRPEGFESPVSVVFVVSYFPFAGLEPVLHDEVYPRNRNYYVDDHRDHKPHGHGFAPPLGRVS